MPDSCFSTSWPELGMLSLPPTSSTLHFWAWIQSATLGTPKFLNVPFEVFDLVLLRSDFPPKSPSLNLKLYCSLTSLSSGSALLSTFRCMIYCTTLWTFTLFIFLHWSLCAKWEVWDNFLPSLSPVHVLSVNFSMFNRATCFIPTL